MVDIALLETVFLLAMAGWLIVLGGAFLLAERRTDSASAVLLVLAGVYAILWQQPALLGFGEAFHVALAEPVFVSLLAGAIFLWTYWLFERHVDQLEATMGDLEDALALEQTLVDVLNHDLRNPVAEARLKVQTLVRDRPELESSLTDVQDKLRQAADVMENGLAYSRVAHGPPEAARDDLDLAETVHEAVDACRDRARLRGVEISVEAPDSVIVTASPLLERAVENLLDNAIKYSPETGTVNVEVDEQPGRVRVLVSDEGPGIPPEEREALLRRFSRRSEAGDGFGLGLAIARRLADLHDGELTIGDSEAGGARVELSIPAPGPASDDDEAAATRPALAGGEPSP